MYLPAHESVPFFVAYKKYLPVFLIISKKIKK